MSDLPESELQIAAKNRAWEVIRQWRDKPMCDDETLAAMVTKAVMGGATSAADAAALEVPDERSPDTGPEDEPWGPGSDIGSDADWGIEASDE